MICVLCLLSFSLILVYTGLSLMNCLGDYLIVQQIPRETKVFENYLWVYNNHNWIVCEPSILVDIKQIEIDTW